MDNEFLTEVFKETNAHMRATEQKSLVLTGAFVGFYLNGYINVLRGQGIASANAADIRVILLFHLVLLFVGSVVYIMQLWYRAWKEHYIRVCLALRQHFIPTPDLDTLFPFWLRTTTRSSGNFSYDNLVMYVTALVNLGVLFLISSDILELSKGASYASSIIGAAFVAYIALYALIHKKMRGSTFLDA